MANERFLDFLMNARPMEFALALKKIGRIHREETKVGPYRFWIDPASDFGYSLVKNAIYEPELTKAIKKLLEPKDTFIDLGGNEGWFSVVAGNIVGEQGRVLCIEPQQRLWGVIQQNFYLNQLPQCTLVPTAIGETNALGEIKLTSSLNTGSSHCIPEMKGFISLKNSPPFSRSWTGFLISIASKK